MTKKNATTEMRRCIGSKTFGIEPHDAPVTDFPAQPSQKDGLGRMCKPHWRQYTNALRKAAVARKAAGDYLPRGANKPSAPEPELELPSGETPAVTARRQKFEARLTKVRVGSDAGQRLIERAGKGQEDAIA